STGNVTGTPTTAGTANFTVTVTDNNGQAASKALSITIVALPSIGTTSLPGGEVGVAYSQGVSGSGGSGSLTWTISAGALPNGLGIGSSSGVISGTPTASGTFSFTVKVTDANNQSATKALSIAIVPQPSITTAQLPNGEVSVNYTTTLTASGGT